MIGRREDHIRPFEVIIFGFQAWLAAAARRILVHILFSLEPAQRVAERSEAIGKIESMKVSAQDRARKIKVILFDVDGVLTDGGIWLIPVPVVVDGTATTKMVEAKGYNAHDGTAISLARLGGLKCGIITKRISETVALARARPEARVRLPGAGVQDESSARDHGEGRRDAR